MTKTKAICLLAPIHVANDQQQIHIGRTNMQIPKHALIGITVATDGRRWLVTIQEGRDPATAMQQLAPELPVGRDLHTPQDARTSQKPAITLGSFRTP